MYQLFQQAIDKLNTLLQKKDNSYSSEHSVALYEQALTLVEEAHVMRDLGSVQGGTLNHYPQLELAQQFLSRVDTRTAAVHQLQGRLSYEFSKKTQDSSPLESEEYLIRACESLLAAYRLQSTDENTVSLMKEVLEALANGKKERERMGNAVYRICGEYVKQGGGYKSWKKRFFVVDDSTVSYFRNRKEWELGPVSGQSKGKPQGTIMFAQISQISAHSFSPGAPCPLIQGVPAKLIGTSCIHLHTPDRTFNMVTSPDAPQADHTNMMNALNAALRAYKVKRDAKDATKKKNSIIMELEEKSWKPIPAAAEKGVQQEKKPKRVQVGWGDEQGKKFVTIIPRETSKFPEWSDDDASDGEDEFYHDEPSTATATGKGTKPEPKRVIAEVQEPEEWNVQTLKNRLSTMNEYQVMKVTRNVLKEYEQEGRLRQLFQCMVADDPQGYIMKLCSVENFEMAKFGMLHKLANHLESAKDITTSKPLSKAVPGTTSASLTQRPTQIRPTKASPASGVSIRPAPRSVANKPVPIPVKKSSTNPNVNPQ